MTPWQFYLVLAFFESVRYDVRRGTGQTTVGALIWNTTFLVLAIVAAIRGWTF